MHVAIARHRFSRKAGAGVTHPPQTSGERRPRAVILPSVASLRADGWRLESAVERLAEAPETFEIPDEEIRSRLVPECDAKLIFTMLTRDGREVVERMWVQITGYTNTGYVGVLNNDPKTDGVPLSYGQRIEFQPLHVIDALPPERWSPEKGWTEPGPDL